MAFILVFLNAIQFSNNIRIIDQICPAIQSYGSLQLLLLHFATIFHCFHCRFAYSVIVRFGMLAYMKVSCQINGPQLQTSNEFDLDVAWKWDAFAWIVPLIAYFLFHFTYLNRCLAKLLVQTRNPNHLWKNGKISG